MRLSIVDKLANKYQDKIIAWQLHGGSAEQIRSHLQAEDLPPAALSGRTGMSLFLRQLDRAREHLLNDRVTSAALGRSFDEAAEAKAARLNIELIGNAVTERLLNTLKEETENLGLKEVHELAQVIYRLTCARRTDTLTTLGAGEHATGMFARKRPRRASKRGWRQWRQSKRRRPIARCRSSGSCGLGRSSPASFMRIGW